MSSNLDAVVRGSLIVALVLGVLHRAGVTAESVPPVALVANPFAASCGPYECAWTDGGQESCYPTGGVIYTPACIAFCYYGNWQVDC